VRAPRLRGARDGGIALARVDGVCLPDMVSDTGDGLNIDDTTSAAYAMCATRFKKSLYGSPNPVPRVAMWTHGRAV
jgi:hypothetical protein